jgi:ferritin
MPAAERIVTLLDRAELKIKVEKVPEPKEKVLTKSEILSALKNGVIDVSYAVDRLRAMRYSDEDIEILISLNLPRPKKAKVAG